MYTYKTVPAPTVLIANNKTEQEHAVSMFGELINEECRDGWEFYSLETIAVSVSQGCLAALFGAKDTKTVFNMLVFRKQA